MPAPRCATVAYMRRFLRTWLLLPGVWLVGCYPGGHVPPDNMGTGGSGTGGAGGGSAMPCDVDCSGFPTAPCTQAVCNTGQVKGPLNTCVVVPVSDGNACDDGKFCTTNDFCSAGTCIGGGQNACGLDQNSCSSVICYEETQTCSLVPSDDGTSCTPTDKCELNGVCTVGECVGKFNNCSSSPLSECNMVACDPTTGACTGTPDSSQDGKPCVQSGDLCNVNKACSAGQCVGGTPTDCSMLDMHCQVGVCDSTTGSCVAMQQPVGTDCSEGLPDCQVGACDMRGTCVTSSAPDGTACNDHDPCTSADTCSGGACGGSPVAGCQFYLDELFVSCPDGWTLTGDWQCGMPTATSPVTSFSGNNVLATQLDGSYHNNDVFSANTANSPAIDLSKATSPQLAFWAWVSADTADGWNLNVSQNGGSFKALTTVVPTYPLTVLGLPAWGGDLSAEGWQPYSADLSAFAGSSIVLSFAFGSDPTGVDPGVYIDNVIVAEPPQIPLYITTPSPLVDAYVGTGYLVALAKVGGSSPQWSINMTGGVNTNWLHLDQTTGVLTGTPLATETGPVTFTVHVQEPTLASNFAEQTYTLDVLPDIYYTSWEGACPAGWTLTRRLAVRCPHEPGGALRRLRGDAVPRHGDGQRLQQRRHVGHDDRDLAPHRPHGGDEPEAHLPDVDRHRRRKLRRRQPGDQHRTAGLSYRSSAPSRRCTR